MPALMAKRLSSERCAIRRELHRRRNLAAAPKGGIAKKSPAKQSSASTHNSSADEPATKKPTSRPQAGVATSPASILQHAPVAVATKEQIAAMAMGDGAVAKEIAASAPLGQVAKRCTAPPRRSALIPTASKMKVKVSAGVPNKSTAPPPPSRSLELSAKMPSAAARPRSPSIRVKKGMTVKVRTRAGVLPTGHCLVLWLAARVVSAAADDDGFLDVIYNGNFPRDDPSRTVRVAMDDVRSMPAVGESWSRMDGQLGVVQS
ncbi:hypothetical protein CFC21_068499 [Triticum aestivum]|uniref:Uncharacterized protein n=2 Tax=Triticum aestivum TaxID=4565 RepID=A0A9R1HBG9_WHEAT|nr:hypothetical protein CFC21_068496 [Triticum aestivum]KAF7061835.1 hypothetical protein CFC21_068499 [Triticum aestivum]